MQKNKTRIRTIDDFERDYYDRYGIYLDHHMMALRRTHTTEEVDAIIKENVKRLYDDFIPAVDVPF
jgi:hypothetical protein